MDIYHKNYFIRLYGILFGPETAYKKIYLYIFFLYFVISTLYNVVLLASQKVSII